MLTVEEGMRRVAFAIAIVLVLGLTALIAAQSAGSGPGVSPTASVSFTLYGTNQGWGLTAATITSPGPTLTVTLADVVTMTLYSANGVRHNFYVDYNGNGIPDATEPVSPDFSSPTTPLVYTFTAGTAGTFTYYCDYHAGKMFGTFVVQAPPANTPPTASMSMPDGARDWTGGTVHRIWWNMSDAQDANAALVVYLNYTSSAGSGAIAGPRAGTANPNAYDWTVPAIDATDVLVNLTVIDSGARKAWSQAPVPVVDSTAPGIALTMPANGATGVPATTNVQVQWTEPMDPAATASPASFGLQEVAGGAWVPGAFSWNSPMNTVLTFNPSASLALGTQYRAVVNTTARDASDPGNALAAASSWTFTTGAVVDTVPPRISGVSAAPPLQEVGSAVNVSASVTDNFGVGAVWLEVRSPLGTTNASMRKGAGATYHLDRPYAAVGLHNFTIWASDTSNLWSSAGGQFEMQDTQPPSITSASAAPATQELGAPVNVSARVTDSVGVAGVWLVVAAPSGSTNASMTAGPGGVFYVNRTYAETGVFGFTIWASDVDGLWASISGQFEIVATIPPAIQHTPPASIPLGDPANLTATVTDATGVAEVRLNWTDTMGMTENVTMSPNGTTYWYVLPAQIRIGSVSYFIWARDANDHAARTPTATVPVLAPAGVILLYGDTSEGWGYGPDNITSPGPTIRVPVGAHVEILLLSADRVRHNFLVDYDGDGGPSTGEPLSNDFRDRGVRLSFVADRGGTFTYLCEYHAMSMRGTFIVGSPAGGQPDGDAGLWAGAGLLLVLIVAIAAVMILRRRRPAKPPESEP